jgi:uncharacterized OsmC-like protein
VIFSVRGEPTGRMRNELTVTMVKPEDKTYELPTDEGKFHGGEDTAPAPLSYFAAAWAGCVMTQIRAFAKRLGVQLDHLGVTANLEWSATMHADGTYDADPQEFGLVVTIGTPDVSRVEALQSDRSAGIAGGALTSTPRMRTPPLRHSPGRSRVGGGSTPQAGSTV